MKNCTNAVQTVAQTLKSQAPCRPPIIRKQTWEHHGAAGTPMTTRKTGANVQCQVEENHINFSKPKFAEMLINKKNVFFFIDQQNVDWKFYWSTKKSLWKPTRMLINKKKLKILLINKISASNFVDQQNFDFSILSLARGVRPPRGSARQIFGSHIEL